MQKFHQFLPAGLKTMKSWSDATIDINQNQFSPVKEKRPLRSQHSLLFSAHIYNMEGNHPFKHLEGCVFFRLFANCSGNFDFESF